MECQKLLTEIIKEHKNVTLTKVILLRETMHSCFQRSRCFWNRNNVVWPFRCEPSSGWTVPTTAVCSFKELSWLHLYYAKKYTIYSLFYLVTLRPERKSGSTKYSVSHYTVSSLCFVTSHLSDRTTFHSTLFPAFTTNQLHGAEYLFGGKHSASGQVIPILIKVEVHWRVLKILSFMSEVAKSEM
jgi:hypothetical protein